MWLQADEMLQMALYAYEQVPPSPRTVSIYTECQSAAGGSMQAQCRHLCDNRCAQLRARRVYGAFEWRAALR